MNPSSSLSKRREIERKQREKLRAQAEEDDAAREERVARLRATRKKEQRRFDAESARIRQANVLAMAHSLRTKAEPRIYWRPWELREDEEERIREQVREAEEAVQREREEDDGEEGGKEEDVAANGESATRTESGKEDEPMQDAGGEKPSEGTGSDEMGRDNNADRMDATHEAPTDETSEIGDLKAGPGKPGSPMDAENDASIKQKEEMDEGAEDGQGDDAVIY